tara:strand:- start:2965 stop:3411 length:447 start_codon:yes stop_codon:yes gene_type:complete
MMFDLFLKLNNREKNLIIVALILVVLFVIFVLSKNIIDSYSLSKQQHIKAKSDYEYVFLKVEIFNNSINNPDLTINALDSFLKDIESDVLYKSEVINENDKIIIKFQTDGLEDSLSISNEILNKFNLGIEKIEYSRLQDKSQTILFLN